MKKGEVSGGMLVGVEDLFISGIDCAQRELGEDLFLTRSREGIFSCALVMWLMLCQRFEGRKSMVKALEMIAQGGGKIVAANIPSRRAQRCEISTNSGGYCRARERTELAKVKLISDCITKQLIKQAANRAKAPTQPCYLLDGTTINLLKTSEIQGKYPCGRNQNRELSNPQMLCVCLHDLDSGIAIMPEYGPYRGNKATSEQALARRVITNLPEKSLIIGDRNFGVFSTCYWAVSQGHAVLFRLSSSRAKSLYGKELPKGSIEKEIIWHKTDYHLKKHPDIPEEAQVPGRFIKTTVRHAGFRPFDLYLFTTSDLPSRQLINLYKQRQNLETDIRHLKFTLGMEMLSSKSTQMVEKELLLGVLAYNLLRAVIAHGARKINLSPRRISFSNAVHWVQCTALAIQAGRTKQEVKIAIARFYKGLAQLKLPNRPAFRVEPRKLARKRKLFPLMKNRKEEQQLALGVLQKYGHREYLTRVSRKY